MIGVLRPGCVGRNKMDAEARSRHGVTVGVRF